MVKNKKNKNTNFWPAIFGVSLALYSSFTLLDAFLLPHDIVSVAELEDESQTNELADTSFDENQNTEINNEETEKNIKNKTEETSIYTQTDNGEDSDDTKLSSETEAGVDTETASFTETETQDMESSESSQISSDPIVTENSYDSDSISIQITTLNRYNTTIYIADIVLSNADSLRTALALDSFGRNLGQPTSVMAENNDAILAINGDYYGFRDKGIVMRGGYLYRDSVQGSLGYEDLIIYQDGDFEIMEEATVATDALIEKGAREIFSFGPGLVKNGEITITSETEVERSMRSNPRTTIGQIGPLHYIMVASDGRTAESAGLTLYELALVMQELGCKTAYNLDGGGSTTMWFMGEVINNPVGGFRQNEERAVSDIVYIGE